MNSTFTTFTTLNMCPISMFHCLYQFFFYSACLLLPACLRLLGVILILRLNNSYYAHCILYCCRLNALTIAYYVLCLDFDLPINFTSFLLLLCLSALSFFVNTFYVSISASFRTFTTFCKEDSGRQHENRATSSEVHVTSAYLKVI